MERGPRFERERLTPHSFEGARSFERERPPVNPTEGPRFDY